MPESSDSVQPGTGISYVQGMLRAIQAAFGRGGEPVMPVYPTSSQSYTTQLQSTLSSTTSGSDRDQLITPHHPITCSGDLMYNEDNTFECTHAKTGPNDSRTEAAIRHSLVLLLLEPAVANVEWKYKTPDELAYEWYEKHGEVWE